MQVVSIRDAVVRMGNGFAMVLVPATKSVWRCRITGWPRASCGDTSLRH